MRARRCVVSRHRCDAARRELLELHHKLRTRAEEEEEKEKHAGVGGRSRGAGAGVRGVTVTCVRAYVSECEEVEAATAAVGVRRLHTANAALQNTTYAAEGGTHVIGTEMNASNGSPCWIADVLSRWSGSSSRRSLTSSKEGGERKRVREEESERGGEKRRREEEEEKGREGERKRGRD